jgi:hypothetical protein
MAVLKRSRYKYLGFPRPQLQRIATLSALQSLRHVWVIEEGIVTDAQDLRDHL